MTEPTLTLFSDALLSKWGFNDGDMPWEVWDYLEQSGARMHKIEWHAILIELVKRYLLPALDQDIEVVETCTNHNPIRAWTVDGEPVEGLWHDIHRGESRLTPEYVEIPMSDIAALTGEF